METVLIRFSKSSINMPATIKETEQPTATQSYCMEYNDECRIKIEKI